MRFDLATLARRTRNPRRKTVTIRDIAPPSTFAGDLYRTGYAPVVALWAQTAERLAAEYARTLAAQTTDSPADLESTLDAADREFGLLSIILTPALERWALQVERWYRGKWRNAVLSATGVDLRTMMGASDVRKTLGATINWNVALVKDVSAEARRRMASIVYDGLRGNKPARDVAKALRESVGLSRKRSIRIASDQLAKLTSGLADERRREAGIDKWQWRHSQKAHPRADHIARNGKIYSDDPKGVGQVVNGQAVLAPPEDGVGQLPFCGCRSQSVLEF